MDPGASNPNTKKALNNIANLAKNAIKLIGKLAKKVVELLIKSGPVGISVLIILIAIIIVVAYYSMPGQMRSKLLGFFSIDVGKWFNIGATEDLADDYSDIVDVSNYLEEMGYNLIGDGFVRPKLLTGSDNVKTIDEILTRAENPDDKCYGYTYKEETENEEDEEDRVWRFYDKDGNIVTNLTYYDGLGRKIDNETGNVVSDDKETYTDKYGIIRNIEDNKVAKIDAPEQKLGNIDYVFQEENNLKYYRLLRTYLLSNYRIYNLKNSDEGMLKQIGALIRAKTGGDQDGWAKGLIKLYNAHNGIATDHWSWGLGNLFDKCEIDGKTLSLKNGFANNAMNFSIEGWAPRYGMSLEFLLSLHLGTNAPDLVYAMLQNFDTEVQVYIDDSGKATVNSRYIDPNFEETITDIGSQGIKLSDITDALKEKGHYLDALANWASDVSALQFLTSFSFNKKSCQDIFEMFNGKIESPPTCYRQGIPYKVVDKLRTNDNGSAYLSYFEGLTSQMYDYAESFGYEQNIFNQKDYTSVDRDTDGYVACAGYTGLELDGSRGIDDDFEYPSGNDSTDAWEGNCEYEKLVEGEEREFEQEVEKEKHVTVVLDETAHPVEEANGLCISGLAVMKFYVYVDNITRRTWFKEESCGWGAGETCPMTNGIKAGDTEDIEYTYDFGNGREFNSGRIWFDIATGDCYDVPSDTNTGHGVNEYPKTGFNIYRDFRIYPSL